MGQRAKISAVAGGSVRPVSQETQEGQLARLLEGDYYDSEKVEFLFLPGEQMSRSIALNLTNKLLRGKRIGRMHLDGRAVSFGEVAEDVMIAVTVKWGSQHNWANFRMIVVELLRDPSVTHGRRRLQWEQRLKNFPVWWDKK
jgi:hypothetical protein